MGVHFFSALMSQKVFLVHWVASLKFNVQKHERSPELPPDVHGCITGRSVSTGHREGPLPARKYTSERPASTPFFSLVGQESKVV